MEKGRIRKMMGQFSKCAVAFYSCLTICKAVVFADTPEKLYTIKGDELIWYPRTSVGEVVIPQGVKHIGNAAFANCSKIIRAELPEGMQSIGIGAFSCCDWLEEINLPSSITNIGRGAFNGCQKLRGIEIPQQLKKISINAFARCSAMSEIHIPNGVSEIGAFAFQRCEALENIHLGRDVRIIGGRSFSLCKGITELYIPSHVEYVGDGAFSGCENLRTIVLPESLKFLGDYAFLGCKRLERVEFLGYPPFIKNADTIFMEGATSMVIQVAHDVGGWADLLEKWRGKKVFLRGNPICYSESVSRSVNQYQSLNLSRNRVISFLKGQIKNSFLYYIFEYVNVNDATIRFLVLSREMLQVFVFSQNEYSSYFRKLKKKDAIFPLKINNSLVSVKTSQFWHGVVSVEINKKDKVTQEVVEMQDSLKARTLEEIRTLDDLLYIILNPKVKDVEKKICLIPEGLRLRDVRKKNRKGCELEFGVNID